MPDLPMEAESVVLTGRLADRCPSLLAALQAHLDDYETLLPHVFFGEVARWATRRYIDRPADSELAAALEILERDFRRSFELIAASFLENLPAEGQAGSGIRALLGPEITEHLDELQY